MLGCDIHTVSIYSKIGHEVFQWPSSGYKIVVFLKLTHAGKYTARLPSCCIFVFLLFIQGFSRQVSLGKGSLGSLLGQCFFYCSMEKIKLRQGGSRPCQWTPFLFSLLIFILFARLGLLVYVLRVRRQGWHTQTLSLIRGKLMHTFWSSYSSCGEIRAPYYTALLVKILCLWIHEMILVIRTDFVFSDSYYSISHWKQTNIHVFPIRINLSCCMFS